MALVFKLRCMNIAVFDRISDVLVARLSSPTPREQFCHGVGCWGCTWEFTARQLRELAILACSHQKSHVLIRFVSSSYIQSKRVQRTGSVNIAKHGVDKRRIYLLDYQQRLQIPLSIVQVLLKFRFMINILSFSLSRNHLLWRGVLLEPRL